MAGKRRLGFAACALASSFWGCGFFFGKIALKEMNVGAMVLYRFLFATLMYVPLLVAHPPRFDRAGWRLLLLSAFFGVPVQFLLQFSGLARTTVSHAALMVGMMPVILAAGATVFAQERMDRTGWVALAASAGGATLIATGARHPAGVAGPSVGGDMLVVLSLVVALAWVLLNKSLMETYSAVTVSTWGTAVGTAMLAAMMPFGYGWPPVHGVSGEAWAALAASGALCTAAATLLWNWGLTQVPASQAGVLLNMEPLIGSLLGVLVLGESLGASAWTGGGLILAAAVVMTTRSRTRVGEQLPV